MDLGDTPRKRLLIPETNDDEVRENNINIYINHIFHHLQCLNWRYNFQYEMFSPQQWAIAITNARKKVSADTLKIPRREDLAKNSDETANATQVLIARLDDFESAFNNLVAAVTELSEQLDKAQGMLRYCYAICQNPGIKNLADQNKESPTNRLHGLRERGVARALAPSFGGNPQPRAGLGPAGRP